MYLTRLRRASNLGRSVKKSKTITNALFLMNLVHILHTMHKNSALFFIAI